LRHDAESDCKLIALDDGQQLIAKSVVLATGLQFNKLDFPGADCGQVVYGDSSHLGRECQGGETIIVGGGNSAGQAAIDVASTSSRVTVLVRSGSLVKSMSADLIEQLENHPRIEVAKGEIARAVTDEMGNLAQVELKDGTRLPCRAMGLFIGSAPAVEWAGVELDERGFVMTGQHSDSELETSIPGVYAAGDTRHGSKKRTIIAAAEGNQAVSDAYGFCQRIDQRLQQALQPDTGHGRASSL
jgi:thioredoxin reductase (NADPH)